MKRVLICLALIAWSGMAAAVVYKWVDVQGKTQYGDRPPDGVRAEIVALYNTRGARSTPTRTTEPNRFAQTNKNAALAPAGSQVDSSTKKAVQTDVAAVRDKQCTEAQARYKTLIEGRRLYKTGENGERQYMSAEDIDNERLNAKREVDSLCSSSS